MPTIADLVKSTPLTMRSRGDAVKQLQTSLTALGYPLQTDGDFGGATDTAVCDFQKSHNLRADGVVGSITAAALDAALAAQPAGGQAAPAAQPAQTGPATQSECGRPLWVTEAIKWLTTKAERGPESNPVIMEWAHEEGGDIAKDYTQDTIPWCALFANMILYKVGLKGTGTLWALDFAEWGVPIGGPAVGAFAPMRRQGGGHITVVVGRDQYGNLMCVGGNQMSDHEVSICPFPAGRPVDFRFPAGVPLPTQVGFGKLPFVKSNGHLSTNEG
jgi:uncharacterized protein (TIGR02594 family)